VKGRRFLVLQRIDYTKKDLMKPAV